MGRKLRPPAVSSSRKQLIIVSLFLLLLASVVLLLLPAEFRASPNRISVIRYRETHPYHCEARIHGGQPAKFFAPWPRKKRIGKTAIELKGLRPRELTRACKLQSHERTFRLDPIHRGEVQVQKAAWRDIQVLYSTLRNGCGRSSRE